ncbi:MAG: PAS domain-containing protein, partial [Thermoplasmata archaeon]|nr:PAS domain-containing protein [Thermoplasmata archaeon]
MAQTTPSEVAGTKTEPPYAVLVIDGNEEHQILSVAALTRKGWIVRTAASGKQGLQLALANRFDAVLIGSKLRDTSGTEVVRALAERLPALPKIFVVPPMGEEAALKALESGANSYIVKTPRYTELMPAIIEEHIVEARNRLRLAESEQIQAQTLSERIEAEEKLSHSERRLKMILEQAPVLLWSTDKELRVTSATGGGLRALEFPALGKGLTLFEYFHIPDADMEPIASHRRALTGESVATQIEWQGRTFDVHIEPLRAPDRTIIGTIGMAFDVTERTRTEESLRRSEERFQLLGRATNDVVWDWDIQTDGLWMNENVTKVFGYRAEEIEPTGNWWTAHLHPEDRERFVASTHEAILSGASSWNAEYRFRRTDGRYATIVDRGYVLHDAQGHPLRLIGSAMDVSKQRRAEAIQSAVYKISEAANTAKDLTDLYGRIHRVIGGLMPATNFYIALHTEDSDTLEFPYFVDEAEGPPPPQKLGRGLTEYVLRSGRPLLASAAVFDELLAKGEVVQVGPPSVDWVGAPLVSHGKTIGVIVVQSYAEGVRFTDEDKAILNFVSEQVAMAIDRKKTQEQLHQTSVESERLATMGQLAGFIAHELNTPLTSISLLTSAIARRMTDESALEKLEKINVERRRAADIIRLVLSLTRSREMKPMETDLRPVVEAAVELAKGARKKGVSVDVNVGTAPIRLPIDPLQIQEAIVNLVKNALDATSEGSVGVRIESRAKSYAIIVSDTGVGMSKETLSHLFEPFFTT